MTAMELPGLLPVHLAAIDELSLRVEEKELRRACRVIPPRDLLAFIVEEGESVADLSGHFRHGLGPSSG